MSSNCCVTNYATLNSEKGYSQGSSVASSEMCTPGETFPERGG